VKKFSIFNFSHKGTRFFKPSQLSIKRGFTLVELVVVLAILIVGSTAGMASFRRFGDSKILDTSAAEVESLLNNARISAVTQTFPQSPITCVHPLQGYSIRITSINNYEMDAYCNGARSIIKTKRLPNGIAFGVATDEISFRVATGASTSPVVKTIILSGSGVQKQIIIDTAGNITRL